MRALLNKVKQLNIALHVKVLKALVLDKADKLKTSAAKQAAQFRAISKEKAAYIVKAVKGIDISRDMFTCRNILAVTLPAACVIALVFTVSFWTSREFGLAVIYNGKQVASVTDESVFETAQGLVNNRIVETGAPVALQPEYEITFTDGKTLNAQMVCNNILKNYDGVISDGCGLYLDGSLVGVAKNKAMLDVILDTIIKEKMTDDAKDFSISFYGDVKTEEGLFPADEILDYTKMDSLARKTLKIQYQLEKTYKKTTKFKTVNKTDSGKYKDYKVTKQQGVNGVSEFTDLLTYIDGELVSTVCLKENVISAKKDKIVVTGTKKFTEGTPTGTFMWPVPYSHEISSYYEPRWGTFHYGIDVAASGIYGQDIVASDGGTVTWAGYDSSGYGNYVIIDHGNGLSTLYGHCSAVYVEIGDKVKKSQLIAAVGDTGDVTGVHLHFEILSGGTPVNPMNYLS